MTWFLTGLALGTIFAHRIRFGAAWSFAWLAFRSGPLRGPLIWLSQVVDNPEQVE